MAYKLSKVCGIMAVVALCGCATEPTYSPPERSSALDTCPIGEVWVCRDHYPSRLNRDYEQPKHCMCEDPQRVW